MRKIITILSFTAAAFLFTVCTEPLKIYEGTALGLPQKSYEISTLEGSVHVDVISNSEYNISSDATWVSFPAKGQGREGFDIEYQANEGVARIATFILSVGQSHSDTLFLRQRGKLIPSLEAEQTSVTIEGAGTVTVALTTNLLDNEITPKLVFPDGTSEKWIGSATIRESKLVVEYLANPSIKVRTARIDLDYVDEYGYEASFPIYMLQKGSEGSEGTVCSMTELRALATAEGVTIEDDLILEGISVGNTAGGNMGDNTQLAIVGIDYSVSQRTIYFESKDGVGGVRILCKTPEDNVFGQFDAARIFLKGMTLYKHASAFGDDDPEYYYMEGFTASNILSREASSAPVKEKTIASLTDDDIFTYVTLKDCQLPFRKGSLTPIDERLTSATGVNKVAKFAINLYDKEGSDIYLYTNTTCLYRRDGHRLPYGSGDMKGVVVHELFTRFAYQDNDSGDEDTYGNIGRYQLRHTCPEDFCMKQDMEDGSFSGIIAEWRYVLATNQEKYYATDGDKTAFFKHSSKDETVFYDDFSYLGPIGDREDGFFGKNVGNVNGLGVIMEDGVDWMGPQYTGMNSENAFKVNNTGGSPGCGISPSTIGASWATNNNYDSSGNPAGYVLNFSTKDVNASRLTLHLAMMSLNVLNKKSTGPRHFHLYSSTDNSSWTEFGSFTLPDFTNKDNPVTQLWQTPGYVQMTFTMPQNLCDKEKVFVRIFPDKDKMVGTHTEYLVPYPGTEKNIPRTVFNYIGLRYND